MMMCAPMSTLMGLPVCAWSAAAAANRPLHGSGKQADKRVIARRQAASVLDVRQMRVRCVCVRHRTHLGDAPPHGGGRELGHELHVRARVQRAVQRVHDAVDVVQRQGVQDGVGRRPLPRPAQRPDLRHEAPACALGQGARACACCVWVVAAQTERGGRRAACVAHLMGHTRIPCH